MKTSDRVLDVLSKGVDGPGMTAGAVYRLIGCGAQSTISGILATLVNEGKAIRRASGPPGRRDSPSLYWRV